MGISDTKQKILDASLQLFNENGINNVRLQQIADETGISVGNLAYHFNNKEAITESLINNVIDCLQESLKKYGTHESLIDLDLFFKEFYKLCIEFRFFNFDILEIKRNFPDTYQSLQPLFNKVKLQLERRFELFLQQRLLQKEANLKYIAADTWLFMFFIPAEGQLNGKGATSENLYRRRIWDYITLHFTPRGITEFNAVVEPEFSGK
jgi:AcrR family transcriptional regulator